MKNTKALAFIPLAVGGFISAPSVAHAADTANPVAVSDSVTAPFAKNYEIKELANDHAGAGATWSKVEIREPDGSWGTSYDDNTITLKVNSSKNIDFSTIEGFTGEAGPFTYKATNSLGKEVTATITINVKNVKSPTAVNDYVNVTIGTTNFIDVLKNDKRGEPNAALSGVMFKNSSGNFVSELTTPDGRYFVTPEFKVGFVASSTFKGVSKYPVTYRAIDLNNNSSEATLTVYTKASASSTGKASTSPVVIPSKTDSKGNGTVTMPHHSTSTMGSTSNGKTVGPIIQTDNVPDGSSNGVDSILAIAGLMAAGGGVVVAKKRK